MNRWNERGGDEARGVGETYLGMAARDMFQYTRNARKQPDRELEHLVDAATLGCEALERVSARFEDESYMTALEQAEEHRHHERYREVIGDLDEFDDFLHEDKKLMVHSGVMDKQTADLVFRRIRLMLSYIRREAQTDLRQLPGAVYELRDRTCGLVEQLEREDQRRRRWKLVRRVAFGVGGVAIVTTNLTADIGAVTTTFGTIPPGIITSLSSVIGKGLISGSTYGEIVGDVLDGI